MFLFKTQFEWFFRFLFRFAYLIRFRLSQSSWSQHAVGKCRRDIQQHTTLRHAMLKGSERNNHINVLFIINHAWILYFSINKYEFWDFFSKHNKQNYPFFLLLHFPFCRCLLLLLLNFFYWFSLWCNWDSLKGKTISSLSSPSLSIGVWWKVTYSHV